MWEYLVHQSISRQMSKMSEGQLRSAKDEKEIHTSRSTKGSMNECACHSLLDEVLKQYETINTNTN